MPALRATVWPLRRAERKIPPPRNRRDGGTGVMVDEWGRARWHDVVVGLSGREVVEVASGLVAGDVVVAPGTPSGGALRDGRRIRRE